MFFDRLFFFFCFVVSGHWRASAKLINAAIDTVKAASIIILEGREHMDLICSCK